MDFFLTTLVLFSGLGLGEEVVDSDGSNVVVLDSSNFDQTIGDNPYVLVEVYAPWCGHCKSLAPQYEQAANLLKESNSPVVLAKLDGSQEEERNLVSRLQVRGFPTLIFYNHGVAVQYGGPRTAEGIVAWVTKKSGPTYTALTDAGSYQTYLGENPEISVVGYFVNGSGEYQAFAQAAGHPNFEHINFAITTAEPVATAAGVTLNQIGLKRSFDEPDTYDVSTAEELIAFLNKNAYPYLLPAQQAWNRLREQEVPIGLFIYNDTDEAGSAEYVKLITEVAKNMSGSFGFVSVSPDYLERTVQLGGSGKKLPTIIAVSPLQHNYPLSDDIEWTRENIYNWARGIIGGSIKPHFKSEPVPESQEGSVFKLVGSTFEEVIYNSGKSAVIVEFYAPWCGHCKNLEPIWEQLGEHYASSGVLVAKLDSTTNDNPAVVVSGYPTIYLFVPGWAPIEYSGARDLESLINFIDQNTKQGSEAGAGDLLPVEDSTNDDDDNDAVADDHHDEL